MVTLAGLDGASLVPNTLDILGKGREFGKQLRSDVLSPELIQRAQQGDPAAIAELSQLNPEGLGNLFSAQQAQQGQKVAQRKQFIANERESAIRRKANITKALSGGQASLRNNISKLALELRGDPEFDAQEIAEISNLAVTDPAAAMQQLQAELADADNDIQIADQILASTAPKGSEQRAFEAKTATLSEKDRSKATRIDLGLDPRAVGSAVQTITDEDRAKDIAATEATIASGKETGKLLAQFKLKPSVDKAVRLAVGEAQATIDLTKEKRSNKIALSMYDTAISGLTKALGGTVTGPFAGLIPAMTVGQQSANGAIAAMAPILKQLFRGAGEGTFTDKDQEMLTAMLPTRRDHPETRLIKIQNIDAIVRAKLNATGETPTKQAAEDLSGKSMEELIRMRQGQ